MVSKLASNVASNKIEIRSEKTKKARRPSVYKPFSIAGVGFEPHDLRVMRGRCSKNVLF